jgi:hypothetical protein
MPLWHFQAALNDGESSRGGSCEIERHSAAIALAGIDCSTSINVTITITIITAITMIVTVTRQVAIQILFA